ncbi:TPA: hypothetical protein I4D16_06140 [Enterobacter hormaechei]|nr:hypothetical protein [Enterobacter hormaechei]
MVRNQTTFIPQSLHRGGLVMTTGGHPPPIETQKNALKSCINRSVRRDKAKRIYEQQNWRSSFPRIRQCWSQHRLAK